jgi:hypothetical protein
VDAEEIGRLIGDLENRVERLRSLYEQYFMGIERLEPLTVRKDIDRRLWALRREQIRNTGLRFKLETTIQRYNTYQQYWQRIVREIEAGTYQRDLGRAAQRFGENVVTGFARRRQKMYEKGLEKKAERDARLGGPGASQTPPAETAGESAASNETYDVTFEDSDVADAAPVAAKVVPSAPLTIEPLDLDLGLTGSFAPPAVPVAPPRGRGAPPPAPVASPAAAPPAAPVAPRVGPPRPVATAGTSPVARPAPPGMKATAGPGAPPAPPPLPSPRAPFASSSGHGALPSPQAVAGRGAPTPPKTAPAVTPGAPPAPSASKPGAPIAVTAPARAAVPAALSPAASRPDVRPPAVASEDNALSPIRLRQIYGAFVEAKRKANESTASVTYEKVVTNLESVAKQLRAKHKARSVDFEVVLKNGKPVLKPVVKG